MGRTRLLRRKKPWIPCTQSFRQACKLQPLRSARWSCFRSSSSQSARCAKSWASPRRSPRLHAGLDLTSHLEFHQEILDRLARVSAIEISDSPLTGANTRSTPAFDVAVVYEKQIDVAAERERLTKELARLDKQITANQARLSDTSFTAKAPAHIVEGLRKQTADLITLRDKTRGGLDSLG
jgi:valyl-tRNA synthetase